MRRLSPLIVVALAGAGFARPAAAVGVHATGQIAWRCEPWILTGLAVAVAAYVLGMQRMGAEQRRRLGGRLRCTAFMGGILTLFVALVSPLAMLSRDLFSADMTQHLLLWLVAPPLLVHGRPLFIWRQALNRDAQRPIAMQAWLHKLFSFLMRPLTVWLLFSFVLCFWHLPGPYDFAVRHQPVHDFEHFSFLAAALAFWTIVIAPDGQRPLSYVATMFYVLSFGFEMALIGAILTFAPHLVYSVHAHTTAAFGLTPLQDQQLAGVSMWILANVSHLGTLCVLVLAWFRESERRQASVRAHLPTVGLRCVLIAPLLLAVLTGCGGEADSSSRVSGGDPQHGIELIRHYGCGACHTIPGIENANGVVGPPLTRFGDRMFIAGLLRNEPDNLVHWIRDPQSVVPGVDMPDMGIEQDEARDIAAYLYTLR